MLRLLPSPPPPVTKASGLARLERVWESLDLEGRKLLLANAEALLEITGPGRRPEKRV